MNLLQQVLRCKLVTLYIFFSISSHITQLSINTYLFKRVIFEIHHFFFLKENHLSWEETVAIFIYFRQLGDSK